MPVNTEVLSFIPACLQNILHEKILNGPASALEKELPSAIKLRAVVFFLDVSGFTKLSERLTDGNPEGAEGIAFYLNTYFAQLVRIIAGSGGDIMKFAGDATIVLFHGENENLKTLATRAVQCAMEVQARMHKAEFGESVTLSAKVGIGAGDVTIVQVGDGNRVEYLPVGEPLLQAFGSEGHCQPGQVVISPEVATILADNFKFSPVGEEGFQLLCDDGQSCALVSKQGIKALTELTDSDATVGEVAEQAQRYIPGSALRLLNSWKGDVHGVWAGELRRVTVLFINVGVPPAKLISSEATALDELHSAIILIQKVLYSYEGSLNKFLMDDKGSTMVCAFGLSPCAHLDDPTRAILAALKLHAKLRDIGLESAIGVTTGLAFCGIIGAKMRREYTIIGDVVNLAARLMQNATKEKLGVICSTNTFHSANGLTFEYLPPLQVKGKSRPVAVFAPVNYYLSNITLHRELMWMLSTMHSTGHYYYNPARKHACFRDAIDQQGMHIFGREAEVDYLVARMQQVQSRKGGGMVVLEGDAGLGKTLLLKYTLYRAFPFLHSRTPVAPDLKSCRVLAGAGLPYSQVFPLGAWLEIFGQLFHIEGFNNRVALETHISTTYTRMFANDASMLELLPLLNALVPTKFADSERTRQMSTSERWTTTLDVAAQIVQVASEDQPIVIVLEDAMWMGDKESWELLMRFIAMDLRNVLIIVSTRKSSRFTAHFGYEVSNAMPTKRGEDETYSLPEEYFYLISRESPASYIRLARLKAKDMIALVCRRLCVSQVPEAAANIVLKQSRGNPSICNEFLSALESSGAVYVASGVCTLASNFIELTSRSVPFSIHSRTVSDLDTLPFSQSMLLKIASVLDDTFTLEMLYECLPTEYDDLEGDLECLVQQSYLHSSVNEKTGVTEYTITGAFTKYVIYQLMLNEQRKRLHQKAAEYYEANVPEKEKNLVLLARHWEGATVKDKALRCLEKAKLDKKPGHDKQEMRELMRKLKPVRKEGWMFKSKHRKKALYSTTKTRFVVLKESCLYYYQNKDDAEPLGVIPLHLCKLGLHHKSGQKKVMELSQTAPPKNYYFWGETNDETTQWIRVLVEEEDVPWAVGSMQESPALPVNDDTQVYREGQMGKTKKNTFVHAKIRWFKLTDQGLYYYTVKDGAIINPSLTSMVPGRQSQDSDSPPPKLSPRGPRPSVMGSIFFSSPNLAHQGPQPIGVIPLHVCSLQKHGMIEKKYCFELVAPQKSYFLWVDSKEDYEDWCDSLRNAMNTLSCNLNSKFVDAKSYKFYDEEEDEESGVQERKLSFSNMLKAGGIRRPADADASLTPKREDHPSDLSSNSPPGAGAAGGTGSRFFRQLSQNAFMHVGTDEQGHPTLPAVSDREGVDASLSRELLVLREELEAERKKTAALEEELRTARSAASAAQSTAPAPASTGGEDPSTPALTVSVTGRTSPPPPLSNTPPCNVKRPALLRPPGGSPKRRSSITPATDDEAQALGFTLRRLSVLEMPAPPALREPAFSAEADEGSLLRPTASFADERPGSTPTTDLLWSRDEDEFLDSLNSLKDTARDAAIQRLYSKCKQYHQLVMNINSFSVELDPSRACDGIIAAGFSVLECSRICLYLWDTANQCFFVRSSDSHKWRRLAMDACPVAQQVFESATTLNVRNVKADGRFVSHVAENTVALLALPISDHANKTVGVIEAHHSDSGSSFSSHEENLMLAMARQAGMAIRRAQLYDTAVKESKKTESLLRLVNVVSTDLDLDHMLDNIIQAAYGILRAERIALYLVETSAHELVLWKELTATGGPTAEGERVPLGKGLIGQCAESRKTINVKDATSAPGYDAEVDRTIAMLAANDQSTAALCMPIGDATNGVVAVLRAVNKLPDSSLDSSAGSIVSCASSDGTSTPKTASHFTVEDEALMEAFASQVVVGIQNSRLYQHSKSMVHYNQSILASITDSVFTIEGDGVLGTANRPLAEMFGVDDEKMRNSSYEVWLKESNPRLAEDIKRVFNDSTPVFVSDYELKSSRGDTHVFNYRVSPLVGPSSGVLVALDDVTAVKEMTTRIKTLENKERELQEMQRTMAAASETPIEGAIREVKELLSADGGTIEPSVRDKLSRTLELLRSTDLFRPAFAAALLQQKQTMDDSEDSAGHVRAVLAEYTNARKLSVMPSPRWTGLTDVVESHEIDAWGHNVWDYDASTVNNFIIQIFHRFNLIETFSIPLDKLQRFILCVRKHYHPNAYHNFEHAYSVLHCVYMILTTTSAAGKFTPLDLLAMVIGALCHDIDHPGYNNSYMCSTDSELALVYNDISVLENHHCSLTFKLLRDPESNFLSNLARDEFMEVRKAIIDAILVTDMSQHFKCVSKFKNHLSSWQDSNEAEGQPLVLSEAFHQDNKEERQLLMDVIVHSADISNPLMPFDLSRRWSHLVVREFHNQAQIEKKKGIPLSPSVEPFLSAPDLYTHAKVQINFIDYVVAPLWEALAGAFPELSCCITTMKENRAEWQSIMEDSAPLKE